MTLTSTLTPTLSLKGEGANVGQGFANSGHP